MWFKRSLYAFLLAKCAYWLCWYDLLFGENAIAYTHPFNNGWLIDSAFVLYGAAGPDIGYYFLLPLLILCACGLFNIRLHVLSDLVVWWIVVNIHNKIYPTLTGGEFLLNQLLLFNAFISLRFTQADTLSGRVRIAGHNFAVAAVMVQLCLVYFFSALTKFSSDHWMQGEALILTAQVEHFSLPFISSRVDSWSGLLVFLNYFVLFYQASFPIVVWFKKIKKPFLLAGIAMHLYIAFAMGLLSFGIIMILAYIYFWPWSPTSRLNT